MCLKYSVNGLTLLLACLLTLPASADDAGLAQDAIIRGSDVDSGDPVASHTVRLHISGMLCTGTLIAPDMVLTAAHCFKHKPRAENIEVGFGVDGEEATRGAEAYGVHPSYKQSGPNDIAVIQLRGGLPRGYNAAERIGDASRFGRGQELVVAGFGRTDPDRSVSSPSLRKATVRMLSQKSNEMLLASVNGNSCDGDSGGPSFLRSNGKLLLVGVVSRGDKHCEIDEVHGRVDAHKAWIEKAMRELRAGGANEEEPDRRKKEAEEDSGDEDEPEEID